MKHLSALDALFLQLETPETPMHVGSLMVMRRPPGRRDPRDAIAAHVGRRLHLAPVFTRVLGTMPLGLANPVWRHGGEVDLEYHIRRLTLPRPGTLAQLETAVAKLHAGELDRTRPLWQFTVIDGLKGGDVGVYAKIHHAALDGQGGVAVAQALLDVQPKPRKVDRPRARPASAAPSALKMVGEALLHTASQYGRIVKAVPAAAKAAGATVASALTSAELRRRGVAAGPHTRLNTVIGPGRRFATARIPLAEVKAIAGHFDAKVNDVVLATVAGALRRRLAKEQGALARPMACAVPLSLRAPGDTTQENQVTMMLVALATNVADPAKRMKAIRAASARAKLLAGGLKGAIPTDVPSLGLPWLMAAITPLYRKAVGTERLPVIANVVVSNVPGPQQRLYFAGAEVTAYYPVSIVTHGLGLNVTIMSYHGSLDYGLVSCSQAMPDLRQFAQDLKSAHKELLSITEER